jgi:uncharacterized protein YgiM (DUF1202 family)
MEDIDRTRDKISTCADMNVKHWMFLAALLSLGLVAESVFGQASPIAPQDTPPPVIPAGEAPASPAPKPDAKKKTSTKPKAATTTTAKSPKAKDNKDTKATKDKKPAEPEKAAAKLSPGPAVAREKNVNVRGQAAINSEIVVHLKRGDLVTVLEEVTIKKPKTDEPARWAKVSLPADAGVWVSTQFINRENKTVVPKRLNVRSGPGENYSILGRIDRGSVVKELEIKGEWMKIEAPTNAYAFVAAHLLSTDPADLGPALAKANPPPPAVAPPPPVVAVVPPPTTVAPATDPVPATPPPPPPTVAVPPPPIPASLTPVAPPPPPADEPPPKRIVTREGVVKGSASIQAPTYFVLRNLDNNKTINYLFAPDTNVVMKGYHLQRVRVTGEEILDERWPNTPVIHIDAIEAVP